jgi:predicted  nucleic acid-binding Zn-ribbon protein
LGVRDSVEEHALEDKLRNLWALQQVDLHLDELEELKGDLPGEVRTLEEKMAALQADIDRLDGTIRDEFTQRELADNDIITQKQKLERYKGQQLAVRTNREYDALTREMDLATETISRREKEVTEHETKATVARNEAQLKREDLTGLQSQLEEKRVALAEVSKATEAEEMKARHEREKILVRIAKSDLAIYERIRRAKKGKAVVPVKRGACGGCFNRVPPQKILELRQNARVHTCERCGRILVSDEITEPRTTNA